MKVCPTCGEEYGDEAAFCARDRSPLKSPGGGLIGQLLADRYQIERKIGEGGMGEVYLARHVLMGRRSAVKVVSPSLARDPDSIGRFNREATNASRINHPNVCAIYDFGLTSDGLLYLAMEYLDGRTLSDALAIGPLPLDQAVSIVGQCAAGLAAAHELGIVHRDLKPDNIMLLELRGGETVKLVDFGIAKAGTGEDTQRVTRTGLVIGTPQYMSPEQLSGDPLDDRSDQYSLALVFYRMVTGTLPFASASAHEAIALRLTEKPVSLTDLAPGASFPKGLQAVLDRALERAPDRRYSSVGDFAVALKGAAAGLAGDPSIALPRTIVVRPARRWRAPALAAGAVVVAAAGWGLWQQSRIVPPVPPTPPAAASDSTTRVVETASEVGAAADSESVVPRGPTPTPPPPPVGTNPARDRITLANLPTLDDLDTPYGAGTIRALGKALLAEKQTELGDSIRAEMSILIGQIMLDQNKQRQGQAAYTRGCTRFHLAKCDGLLAMFKDDDS